MRKRTSKLRLTIPGQHMLLVGQALSLDLERCCVCRKTFEYGEDFSRSVGLSLLFCGECVTKRKELHQ